MSNSKTITFDNLNSTTMAHYIKRCIDQIVKKDRLVQKLMDGAETYSGGTFIQEAIRKGIARGFGFSGASASRPEYRQILDAITPKPALIASEVVVLKSDEMQNNSEEGFLKIAGAGYDAARDTILDMILAGVFSDGSTSITSQSSGASYTLIDPIFGLKKAIAITNTNSLYGIDRSLAENAFFRNYSVTTAVNLSALTLEHLDTDYKETSIADNPDEQVNVIVTTKAIHSKIKTLTAAQNGGLGANIPRDTGVGGFKNGVFYENAEVFWSREVAAGSIFYINTTYTKLYMHSKGIEFGEFQPMFAATGQLAKVQPVTTGVQLICSRPNANGVRSGIVEGA